MHKMSQTDDTEDIQSEGGISLSLSLGSTLTGYKGVCPPGESSHSGSVLRTKHGDHRTPIHIMAHLPDAAGRLTQSER